MNIVIKTYKSLHMVYRDKQESKEKYSRPLDLITQLYIYTTTTFPYASKYS